MKLLLDECVNRRIVRFLGGFEVKTVQQLGWSGIKNGKLLALAELDFDVFVTIDKNLASQQSISKFDLALIVIDAVSNHLDALRPLMPHLVAALPTAPKGQMTMISPPAAMP